VRLNEGQRRSEEKRIDDLLALQRKVLVAREASSVLSSVRPLTEAADKLSEAIRLIQERLEHDA